MLGRCRLCRVDYAGRVSMNVCVANVDIAKGAVTRPWSRGSSSAAIGAWNWRSSMASYARAESLRPSFCSHQPPAKWMLIAMDVGFGRLLCKARLCRDQLCLQRSQVGQRLRRL